MLLRHEFTVPVSAARAWPVLQDLGRIVPCLPGATLTTVTGTGDRTDDRVEGKFRVRAGSITVTYRGSVAFVERDEANHRAVITARGSEARGDGTAEATITARVHDRADGTRVSLDVDLTVTGRLGQVARDVRGDVGGRMLDRFAAGLTELLAGVDAEQPRVEAPAEPVTELTAETTETTAEAVTEAVSDPATHTVTDPAAQTVSEPAAQAVTEPVAEAVAEPAGGPVTAPVDGPASTRPARAASPVASFVDHRMDQSEPSALRRAAPLLALVLLVLMLIRHRRRRAQ